MLGCWGRDVGVWLDVAVWGARYLYRDAVLGSSVSQTGGWRDSLGRGEGRPIWDKKEGLWGGRYKGPGCWGEGDQGEGVILETGGSQGRIFSYRQWWSCRSERRNKGNIVYRGSRSLGREKSFVTFRVGHVIFGFYLTDVMLFNRLRALLRKGRMRASTVRAR